MLSRIDTVKSKDSNSGDVFQDSQLEAATMITPMRHYSRFDQNYGAMFMIIGYLPLIEQLRLQGLDTWWYTIGVARVQVFLK